MSKPLNRLKHHVTGAIERGEAIAIQGVDAVSAGAVRKRRERAPTVSSFKTWDGRRVYDPDDKNQDRADWAGEALALFSEITGADIEEGEALGDLLTNLRHWCDRNGFDFDAANTRAAGMYASETSKTGE